MLPPDPRTVTLSQCMCRRMSTDRNFDHYLGDSSRPRDPQTRPRRRLQGQAGCTARLEHNSASHWAESASARVVYTACPTCDNPQTARIPWPSVHSDWRNPPPSIWTWGNQFLDWQQKPPTHSWTSSSRCRSTHATPPPSPRNRNEEGVACQAHSHAPPVWRANWRSQEDHPVTPRRPLRSGRPLGATQGYAGQATQPHSLNGGCRS